MSKKINIQSKTGPTVKHYGRFHLKHYEVYRDGRKIPTNSYVVALDNENESYEELGLIDSDKSTQSDLLDHLHDWLRGRYNDINRIKQLQDQAGNEEARAHYQHGLGFWELQYLRVDRAIREPEPDYQPDESIYDIPQDPSH